MAKVAGGRKRRGGKLEKDFAPEVQIRDFHAFEPAIKRFLKVSASTVAEAKRRRFFVPTLTRHARRLRGKDLERRRRERDA